MADAKTTPKKKAAKKATHPRYKEMIIDAITNLKERKGSSRTAILKFILSRYNVSDKQSTVNHQLKLSLKKGVSDGTLAQVTGTGAAGSFKVAKSAPKPKKKVPKKVAKKAAKKVVKPKVAKKAGAKKATKKPTQKKSPKAKKPAAKKQAAKKKPAAKKPAVKKTNKPKVKKAAKKAAKK